VAIILKESQRQKQEKDVNEQLYSELESMKVENAKLTKSIDDLKNDSKAK
jgi:cell division protein FtsB